MHAADGAGHLVAESRAIGGERAGVGHLEDAGDASHHGRQGARGKIFLVGEAGLAEMDLGVDNAREDVEAAAVDGVFRGVGGEIAEGGDAAVADGNVGEVDAVVVGDSAVLEDRIVVRHVFDSARLKRV